MSYVSSFTAIGNYSNSFLNKIIRDQDLFFEWMATNPPYSIKNFIAVSSNADILEHSLAENKLLFTERLAFFVEEMDEKMTEIYCRSDISLVFADIEEKETFDILPYFCTKLSKAVATKKTPRIMVIIMKPNFALTQHPIKDHEDLINRISLIPYMTVISFSKEQIPPPLPEIRCYPYDFSVTDKILRGLAISFHGQNLHCADLFDIVSIIDYQKNSSYIIGIGQVANEEDHAKKSAQYAIANAEKDGASPLLQARGIVITISSLTNRSFYRMEVKNAVTFVAEALNKDAKIVFGSEFISPMATEEQEKLLGITELTTIIVIEKQNIHYQSKPCEGAEDGLPRY